MTMGRALPVVLAWVAGISLGLAAAGEPIVLVGTNTPADAGAINAAIAASPEGAEIVFRGKFLINQTIRLLGHRSYRGESRVGTVLVQADGAKLPALVASAGWLDNNAWTDVPTAILHLSLDGNRKGNPGATTAGLVVRSWLTVVEDLCITNCGGDGLRLTSVSADGTRLKNTQVNGRISDCFVEFSGRHGICVEDPGNSCTDWTLCDNWVSNSAANGIHLDNAAGWVVERNHVYGVAHDAIYANRLCAASICDNYLEDFGTTTEAGTWCGLRGTVQGDGASTIANNRIFGFGGEKQEQSQYRYISLTTNYGTGMVVVTGNALRGAGTPRSVGCYFAADEPRALTVVSAMNLIEGVHTPRVVVGKVTMSAGQ